MFPVEVYKGKSAHQVFYGFELGHYCPLCVEDKGVITKIDRSALSWACSSNIADRPQTPHSLFALAKDMLRRWEPVKEEENEFGKITP